MDMSWTSIDGPAESNDSNRLMSLPGTPTADDDPNFLKGELVYVYLLFRGLFMPQFNGPQTLILAPRPQFPESQRMVRRVTLSLSNETHTMLP